VRQVTGEPEQLQLEREPERVELRPSPGAVLEPVEEAEEPGQRLERARVRLRLGEQPQHRLEADQADPEAVGVLARGVVRPDQVRARHRLELAGALVEQELHVAERLEPAAEARLRLADPLRDRADAPALERVQVQHAIGLAEPERPQDDGLGLVAPPGHEPSLVSPTAESISGACSL